MVVIDTQKEFQYFHFQHGGEGLIPRIEVPGGAPPDSDGTIGEPAQVNK